MQSKTHTHSHSLIHAKVIARNHPRVVKDLRNKQPQKRKKKTLEKVDADSVLILCYIRDYCYLLLLSACCGQNKGKRKPYPTPWLKFEANA